MTRPLTKASCAACVGQQGAWVWMPAGDEGDQISITFEHTLLFQMTALRP